MLQCLIRASVWPLSFPPLLWQNPKIPLPPEPYDHGPIDGIHLSADPYRTCSSFNKALASSCCSCKARDPLGTECGCPAGSGTGRLREDPLEGFVKLFNYQVFICFHICFHEFHAENGTIFKVTNPKKFSFSTPPHLCFVEAHPPFRPRWTTTKHESFDHFHGLS